MYYRNTPSPTSTSPPAPPLPSKPNRPSTLDGISSNDNLSERRPSKHRPIDRAECRSNDALGRDGRGKVGRDIDQKQTYQPPTIHTTLRRERAVVKTTSLRSPPLPSSLSTEQSLAAYPSRPFPTNSTNELLTLST